MSRIQRQFKASNTKLEVIKLTPLSLSVLGTVLSLSALFYTDNTQAAIFKCVDANGATSYNQTPCPTETQTQKVIAKSGSSSNAKSATDCRIANNFARRVATQMIAGTPSGTVFDSYGGIDSIPRTSVGVISYVYTHNGNQDNNIERITSLSAARCSAGSYGAVSCDDFPHSFIAEFGGCEMATKKMMPQASAEHPEPGAANPAAETASMPVRTGASTQCKEDVKAKLSTLLSDIQSGKVPSDSDALTKRKTQLQDQMQSC